MALSKADGEMCPLIHGFGEQGMVDWVVAATVNSQLELAVGSKTVGKDPQSEKRWLWLPFSRAKQQLDPNPVCLEQEWRVP